MTICFVLFEANPWVAYNVLGVYTTREIAETAKKQHLESIAGHRSSYAIVPIVMDAAPENHFPTYGKRGE